MQVTKEKFNLARKILITKYRKEGMRLSHIKSSLHNRLARELCKEHSRSKLRAIRKEI